MTIDRRKVIYEGRVQGVGFRMTARRLSTAFRVSGYVRNLADGRVELLVEGRSDVVVSFLQAVLREFGDLIHDVSEESESAEGETFTGFTIRH